MKFIFIWYKKIQQLYIPQNLLLKTFYSYSEKNLKISIKYFFTYFFYVDTAEDIKNTANAHLKGHNWGIDKNPKNIYFGQKISTKVSAYLAILE
jgi:hypothetical protein